MPPANMQHLVKDAIGALGGNRASPSDDGEVRTDWTDVVPQNCSTLCNTAV